MGKSLIYSKHARWYAALPVALDRRGRTRVALALWTPDATCHYLDLGPYRPLPQRAQEAAEIVRGVYSGTTWFRRPREIRCRELELRAELEKHLGAEILVRTDTCAARFVSADAVYHTRLGSF